MTTLKVIKNRIRSVSNTKKITQTMRLVSASKYSRAERELKAVRPLGEGSRVLYEKAEVSSRVQLDSQLIVALTSDRGLCGGIHSGVARAITRSLDKDSALSEKTKIVCVGDRSRAILSRAYPQKILWVGSEVGKKPITFVEAANIAQEVKGSILENSFRATNIFYNHFGSAMSFKVQSLQLYDKEEIKAGKKFVLYDEVDEDTLDSYEEFSVAALIFWIMKEGAASELGARVAAMENATKSAGDMITQLTLVFNRTRQAAITRELIEIISGANAMINE